MPSRAIVPIVLFLALAGGITLPVGASPGQDRYLSALEAARRGDLEGALARLHRLAGEAPASAPVHRDLARLTLALDDPAAVRDLSRALRRRLRRTARDVGANVGMAVLEQARGRRAAAHRHLLTALTAGCRDPLLVPLLLATSPSPDGLLDWLARRRAVIPGDSAFRALEVRALLARNRLPAARRLLEEGLHRDPEHPDLLALEATVLRAAGEETRACETAALALGFLGSRQEVPEVRVPLRVGLARVLAACGRSADAEAVLATLGPLVTPPGEPSLEPVADLGRAEVALARDDPLSALVRLGFRPGDPAWIDRFPDATGSAFEGLVCPREWARALSARALGSLPDLPGAAGSVPRPPTTPARGLGLADREEFVAARLAAGPHERDADEVVRLAKSLREAGLAARGLRLRVLAAFRGLLPAPAAGEIPAGRPEFLLAREIAAAQPGLPAVPLDELVLAPAHGLLRAAFRTGRALELLREGHPDEAGRVSRAGLLDLEEAARTTRRLPPEWAPLCRAWGAPALVLPAIAARTGLARGRPEREVAGDLLRDLGRAVRAWSRLESPWPRSVDDLAVPAGACLVLATPPGPAALALAVGPEGAFAIDTSGADPASLTPCRAARAILWAGPATPESRGLVGLGTPGGPVLVRLPHPGDPALPPPTAAPHAGRPTAVPAGPPRPLRAVVEGLAGTAPGEEPVPGGLSWPAWTGAGLAPPGAPASVGWLAPPSLVEGGFVTPETLRGPPASGPGLVALGLLVSRGEVEPGAWLVAESALLSGYGWALVSRTPLPPADLRDLLGRLRPSRRPPLALAARLAAERPALAARLELWTVAARVDVPGGGGRLLASLAIGAALLAGAILPVVLLLRRRRRRRPVSPSR